MGVLVEAALTILDRRVANLLARHRSRYKKSRHRTGLVLPVEPWDDSLCRRFTDYLIVNDNVSSSCRGKSGHGLSAAGDQNIPAGQNFGLRLISKEIVGHAFNSE
jgi:hypothetical protein